ncbi:MAG: phosphatidate cytidylyltransferase [Planctomycetes bacterium]|nr:phosphatidate cytidylyltransferase [Planctomycetota bacterium]
MLKYRLLFGTLMTIFFIAVVIFDAWLDGSLTASTTDDATVQATILYILIALLIIPAQLELSRLAETKKIKIFTPITIVASIIFAGTWYWLQIIQFPPQIYLLLPSAFLLSTLLLYQYVHYGTSGTIANCGANYFSIVYLGFLSAFVIAIRLDFGLWPLLMFVFVIKSSDIGAYTLGKIFGKHKFSPKISPGKTWEGMAGAIVAAIIVALLFAARCDIMNLWSAAIFGFCFAFIGQFGDLVESMIKRDAEQKDSANNVPGFGGILDVIDSPLFSAPFVYLFFMCAIVK